MKAVRVMANLGTFLLISVGLISISPSIAQAADICPAGGGRRIASMDINGVVKSRACFTYADRKLRVADTDVDGYSARGELRWDGGGVRMITDSNGADNGWLATDAINLGGDNSVQLRACTIDLDMQSGAGYYCTVPWLTITRPSGA